MKDIAHWRDEIDRLDREIVGLLNKRAEAVLQLAPLKRQENRAVHDPDRERVVHNNLKQANNGPLPVESIDNVFEALMAEMRELQRQLIGK
jgi:chorismate mutase